MPCRVERKKEKEGRQLRPLYSSNCQRKGVYLSAPMTASKRTHAPYCNQSLSQSATTPLRPPKGSRIKSTDSDIVPVLFGREHSLPNGHLLSDQLRLGYANVLGTQLEFGGPRLPLLLPYLFLPNWLHQHS